MTRFYQALKQSRRTKLDTATGDASQAKSVRPPSLKKKLPAPIPPLFAADPEENVKLWMGKYFGEVRVSRDDAIRHWLSRPAESRVHSFMDGPAKADPVAEPLVYVLDSSADMPANEKVTPDGEVDCSRVPRFMPTSLDGTEPGHSRGWPKLIFRVGMYSIVGVLLVTLLWAIPVKRRAKTLASSVTTSSATSADTPAPDREPASQLATNDKSSNETGRILTSNSNADVTGPSRIESVSLGCGEVQPCIEVNTSGRQINPQLSTLTEPDRLVMDFAGAEYGAGFHRITVKRGVVKGIRIRAISDEVPASTRVVIDLNAQSEGVLRTMQNKFVMEITPKSSSN
jgi:hypothetical protein